MVVRIALVKEDLIDLLDVLKLDPEEVFELIFHSFVDRQLTFTTGEGNR